MTTELFLAAAVALSLAAAVIVALTKGGRTNETRRQQHTRQFYERDR